MISPFLSLNARHIGACSGTADQAMDAQHQRFQSRSLPDVTGVTSGWSFVAKPQYSPKPWTLSWSAAEAAPAESVELSDLLSRPDQVTTATQPLDNNVLATGLGTQEPLEGETDARDVAQKQLNVQEAATSNFGSPSHVVPTVTINTPRHPNGLPPPEPQLAAVSNLSARDTSLVQQVYPIRTNIESDNSKIYELKACADKAGLYYSSTIWPEKFPYRGSRFLFKRLQMDLNHYIQACCKEKRNKRIMKKHHITLTGQAFTIELRLSGNIDMNKQDIDLRPTIWIVCASEFYKTLVKDALQQPQLNWIEDEPVEVVQGLSFYNTLGHTLKSGIYGLYWGDVSLLRLVFAVKAFRTRLNRFYS